jgi:hypothetical protein
VTSEFFGGRELGGLAGANERCQQLARSARLPGTYKAWLSDANTDQSPANAMTHSMGPYTLVNGPMIANNWDDLIDGALLSPINRNEQGEQVVGTSFVCKGGEVWSGTTAEGTPMGTRGSFSFDCNGWSAIPLDSAGHTGSLLYSDVSWTNACLTFECEQRLPIYCFEQ